MPKKKTAEAAPQNRLKNGRFAKGNKANPGGRPKVSEEVKEALMANTLPAINTLTDIMNNPKTQDKDRIKCAEVILNKTLGKNYQLNDSLDVQKQEAEIEFIKERIKLLKGSTPDFSLLEALGDLFKGKADNNEVE